MDNFHLNLDEAFGQRQPAGAARPYRSPIVPNKRHPHIEVKLTPQQEFLKMLNDHGWANFGHGGYENELIPDNNDEFETNCDHCGAANQVSFKVVQYPVIAPKSDITFHADDEFKHTMDDVEFSTPLIVYYHDDPEERAEYSNISSFAKELEQIMEA